MGTLLVEGVEVEKVADQRDGGHSGPEGGLGHLSMLTQMALVHSFLWLSNIPLYICTTSLSTHLLMDIYVAPMSWL